MGWLGGLPGLIREHIWAVVGFVAVVIFIAIFGKEPTNWFGEQLRSLVGVTTVAEGSPNTQTVVATPPLGPRAELTAKGYSIGQFGLNDAMSTGQYGDVKLFAQLGITLTSPPVSFGHITPSQLQDLVDAGAVGDGPCHFGSYYSDEGILDAAIRFDNIHVLKTLCHGAYVESVVQARDEYLARRKAIRDDANRLNAAYGAFATTCPSQLGKILTLANAKELYLCVAQDNSDCNQSKYDAIQAKLSKFKANAEANGLKEHGFGFGNCPSGTACNFDEIDFHLATHFYLEFGTNAPDPQKYFEEARQNLISLGCGFFDPKAEPSPEDNGEGAFYEKFAKALELKDA